MPHYEIGLADDVDTEELVPLILNFKNASPYKDEPINMEALKAVFDQGICFILLADDKIVGFLLAAISNFHPFLGLTSIATELAWWVEPEHRGHGKKLLEAFLMWSEEFDYVVLSGLDDSLGKLYESYGFTKNEVSYLKRKK